jgi:hypothetical protein
VTTFSGVPVVVDIRANDTGTTGAAVIIIGPANGTASDPGGWDAALHTPTQPGGHRRDAVPSVLDLFDRL